MIIGMDLSEIEKSARERMEEIKPIHEEYLALVRMFGHGELVSIQRRELNLPRRHSPLPRMLIEILGSVERASLGEIEQAVRDDGRLNSKRNTISTRLNEMARAGRIVRNTDGTYSSARIDQHEQWAAIKRRSREVAPTKREGAPGRVDNYRLVQPPVAHISTLKRSEA
jgi:hypothetical protein